MIDEPESIALRAHIDETRPSLTTSRIALVEVVRAVGIANPSVEACGDAERLVESCLLVDVTDAILRSAAQRASLTVRALDAIHLASAQRVEADAMLVYDARLSEAARGAGFTIVAPGTVSA